jgi:hypothetical protein
MMVLLYFAEADVLFWTVIALVFAAVALFYMLGRVLQRSDFEAIAKTELRQVVISVVIALAVAGLAEAMTLAAKGWLGDRDQFQVSEDYLSQLINMQGIPTVVNLWSLGITSLAASSTIKLWGGKALGPLMTVNDMVGKILGYFFGAIIASANIQLISIAAAQAFSMLIIACGAVLRAIPFTREGGSLLIALGFAAYIVWPLTFAVDYKILQQLGADKDNKEWAALAEVKTADIYGYNVMKAALPDLVSFIFMPFTIVNNATMLVMQSTIIGVINLTITIGFARVFSEFLMEIG